jgi:hypothetical protein
MLTMCCENKISLAAGTQEHSWCPTSDGQATGAIVVAHRWILMLVEVWYEQTRDS